METLMEENPLETPLSLKPGDSQIQIKSISIDLCAGDINETGADCSKHFSIRGFVHEMRNKKGIRCSPFISDGDDDSSATPLMDLPDLESVKFKRWCCKGCLLDCCNPIQGSSKESGTSNRKGCQNHRSRRKTGLAPLYARGAANGFTLDGSTSSQGLENGMQVEEGGNIPREPFDSLGNNQSKLPPKLDKGKGLMQDGYPQGPSKENNLSSRGASFLKPINEAVIVPFNGINFDKGTSSRKSGKEQQLTKGSCSRSTAKAVMGPPGDKTTSPKPSKEQNLQKEFAMPPPGGFSNNKQPSQRSGKGTRLQNHSSSREVSKEASKLPLTGSSSRKSTASKQFKQQNEQTPKYTRKRNYAKRTVQQTDIARDKHEVHKGGDNGFDSTSNRETLQHGAAEESDLLLLDKVPLQLDRNEEVGASSKLIEKTSNISTAGRTPVSAGLDADSSPDSDGGPDRSLNSVRPSVQSNRMFKRPGMDLEVQKGRSNMYEEEEEEDFRGSNSRRVPKIRLLSDVIAKHPTKHGEHPDNSKTSPGASHDMSAKVSEQSSKRKASPVESHDTLGERGVSDKASEPLAKTKPSHVGSHDTPAGKGVSVPGILKKRKRTDNEEHLDSSSGVSKRTSVRFAEAENKGLSTSRFRPSVDVSPEGNINTEARKQGRHSLNRTEVDKRAKKARVQDVCPSAVPPQPRPESTDKFEMSLPSRRCSTGDAATSKNLISIFTAVAEERVHGYGKKNSVPEIREDYGPANKFLQFVVPDDDISDSIFSGSGLNRRNDGVAKTSNPSSVMADFRKSASTGNELWVPQAQAGGTLMEFNSGEVSSSFTQQKGITAEGKGRVKDIDINSIPVDDKAPEQGSADDIPMEIVELLAKNQYERRSDDNREKFSLLEPNGNTTAQNSYPSMLKPQASYASNTFGRQFEAMGSGKQRLPDNLYDPSGNSVLHGMPNDENYCARFTGYTQSQGQVPGGAQYSSSMGSTAKSWNGNTIPSFRPPSRGMMPNITSLGRYPGRVSTPLNPKIWPPLLPNQVPLGGLSNQGMYNQGSKVDQAPISFNFERPNIGNSSASSSQPTWHSRTPEFSNGTRQKMVRPGDLSSNEAIPALQLLNLVQVAGSRSSTPPANGNNQYKQYAPGPHFEPYKPMGASTSTSTAASSRHPLYDGEGRNTYDDKGCYCPPPSPTGQRFPPSPYPNEPISYPSRDQRNMGSSSYNSAIGNTYKKRKLPSAGKNAVVGGQVPPMASFPVVQPTRNPMAEVVPRVDERAFVPVNKAEVCMVNRNPAEILDSEEVNSFMIGREELRRGKQHMPTSRLAPYARRPQTILKARGRERQDKS